MKKDQNIEELFRDKFENYEVTPPAYLLENILLASSDARRKRKLVYWRIAGVAAALLLAFIAGWQISQNLSQESLSTTAKNQQSVEQPVEVSKNGSGLPETKSSGAESSEQKKRVTSESNTFAYSGSRENQSTQKMKQVVVSNEKYAVRTGEQLALIQSLKHWFKSNEADSKTLKQSKAKVEAQELATLSVDQQIMKQNQQLIKLEKQENRKARWIVGAQISPVYSISRASHSQVYASNMLNSSSSNPVDLGGGLSVELKKGKRWSVQSGVYYSALNQSSGNAVQNSVKDDLFTGGSHGADYFNTNVSLEAGTNKLLMNSTAGVIEINTVPSGMEIGTNMEDKSLAPAVVVSDARFIQNFDYIEIPLYLRYTLLDAKFNIEMLGGLSSNMLVGNQTFMETGSGSNLIGKTRDMQFVSYSGTLGVGLKYGLTNHLFLNVEPRLKYYLNSLNSNYSVTYKPYSIGVFTGLSYQF